MAVSLNTLPSGKSAILEKRLRGRRGFCWCGDVKVPLARQEPCPSLSQLCLYTRVASGVPPGGRLPYGEMAMVPTARTSGGAVSPTRQPAFSLSKKESDRGGRNDPWSLSQTAIPGVRVSCESGSLLGSSNKIDASEVTEPAEMQASHRLWPQVFPGGGGGDRKGVMPVSQLPFRLPQRWELGTSRARRRIPQLSAIRNPTSRSEM